MTRIENMAEQTPTDIARAQMLRNAAARATSIQGIPELGASVPILGQPRPEGRPAIPPAHPERPEERPQLSVFQQHKQRIAELKGEQPSPARDDELRREIAFIEDLRREANELRLPNGEIGIFNHPKAVLNANFYDARVGVPRAEKEGRGDFAQRGKIQLLEARRHEAYDPTQSVEVDRIHSRTGERIYGYWTDPQHPERQGLQVRYGGMIDDLYQVGTELVLAVVKDRKIFTDQHATHKEYPPRFRAIVNIWNGVIRDVAGHALIDEDGSERVSRTFDDVRDAVEEARRMDPWVPNRMNYENYIQFAADDLEELGEMMPYIIAKVIRKLGTGQPDKLQNRGEGEKEKLDGAMAIFPMESENQYRRSKSELNVNLNSVLTYFFSDKVRLDWGPYLGYLNLLAEGAENNEQQDHFFDVFLDRGGYTMLACQQYLVDDGIFWRYGQKSATLDKDVRDINKLYRWQLKRKREITSFLMSHKLRKMDGLLNLTLDQQGNITQYGDPNHPAFVRLKKIYDEQDAADRRITGTQQTFDADGELTNETRWQEYCHKALEWDRTGKFGEPGEAPRVIFQHPLARSFKRPIKDASGQIHYEFLDMFESDNKVSNEVLQNIRKGLKPQNATWYERDKLRIVKGNMQKAEHLCRNFMLDSAAALAWHYCKTPEEVDEINEYLTTAGMEPITIDEAVPQKRLYRALMQSLIREDKTRDPKDRAFKFYDILTELLDIDIDVPTSALWNLGAHDTNRPALLLATVRGDTRQNGLNTPGIMPAPGMDEKNTGAAWGEKERRLGILLQMVMYAKFGKPIINGKQESRYFNFPGHDTKGAERKGAGVKDIRNWLNLLYGTSTNTVWLNDLLEKVGIPLQQDPFKDFGATEDVVTEVVGLYKGGNEAIFAQTGYEGVLENPRDTVASVKRIATDVEQSKALTSGDKEGNALMKDGPFTSMYLWRDYDLSNMEKFGKKDWERFYAIANSRGALETMYESTYKEGIQLATKTIEPTIKVLKGVVESTFGPNPGAAKFARTLMVLGILKWADTSPEYRTKPGYAFDGNLHLARYFMHQYLLEYGDNGLIYDDNEWDEIMLGYITKQDGTKVIRYEVEAGHLDQTKEFKVDEYGDRIGNGEWVSGTVIEGLIDAFPKKLRDFILKPRKVIIRDYSGKIVYDENGQPRTYDDYILPYGLKSKYPETLANYYREAKKVQADYVGALNDITPRKKVTRP